MIESLFIIIITPKNKTMMKQKNFESQLNLRRVMMKKT